MEFRAAPLVFTVYACEWGEECDDRGRMMALSVESCTMFRRRAQ